MNAAAGGVVFPFLGISFPNNNKFSKSSNLRIPNFPQNEITDNAPYLTSCSIRSTALSLRCEGNRRGRPHRDTASGGTDKGISPQSSDNESPNSSSQEEIIALFRRIQSSIAKDGGSSSTRKRGSDNRKERKAAESVLNVLLQSRKEIREENKVLPKRRRVPKTKRETVDIPPTPDFNSSRPPSNFSKKSPIPKPSTLNEQVVESEESEAPNELHRIEEMKVSELKELAKSRGIKGYSKLKKGELVELLKG